MRPRGLAWLLVAVPAIAALRLLDVVEVRGRSMTPTLQPGDRLLVIRARPRTGDVVLAPDPRDGRRELVKHHLDVLWHDYFKPEHLEKYPDLHETFWKATKQASKVKQSVDAGAAKELLTMIDTIDEMWKATGGLEKTRVNGRPS